MTRTWMKLAGVDFTSKLKEWPKNKIHVYNGMISIPFAKRSFWIFGFFKQDFIFLGMSKNLFVLRKLSNRCAAAHVREWACCIPYPLRILRKLNQHQHQHFTIRPSSAKNMSPKRSPWPWRGSGCRWICGTWCKPTKLAALSNFVFMLGGPIGPPSARNMRPTSSPWPQRGSGCSCTH